MKIAKIVINYIITLILSLVIIAYFFINLTTSTILKESYILAKLEQLNYYDKIYECINLNFENYIQQSGLEETVIDNIVTKEKVIADTKIIIGNLYEGLNQKVDTQEIKDSLNKNIDESLQKQGITNAQKDAIDSFVEHICNEYTDTMSHLSYEQQINQAYNKIMKYIDLVKKASLIGIGILIILILLINLKRIYKSLVLIGISLTTSGAFLAIVNIFINTKIKVQTITILNAPISEVIRNILSEMLGTVMSNGTIMLICGILLIFIANLVHNIKKYKGQEEEQ